MKPTKKRVFRKGDRVRILDGSKWVKRVGYNLIWTELLDEVRDDPRTIKAMEALGFPVSMRSFLEDGKLQPDIPHELAIAIAKMRVLERGFGGPQRSIHYFPKEEFTGRVTMVLGKGVSYTGERYPSVSGVSYTQDGPEDWYEQGGLLNRKANIILHTFLGEIEEKYVIHMDDEPPLLLTGPT